MGLCPGGSLSRVVGSLSRGVSVQGASVWGSLSMGISVQGVSVSGSLSRGWGLFPGGSPSRYGLCLWDVSVQRGHCLQGVSVQVGLCPGSSVWGFLSRGGHCPGVSVQGQFLSRCASVYGGSLSRGLCLGGLYPGGVSV